MSLIVRRVRAALHKFDPEQDNWHDARLTLNDDDTAVIEVEWKNDEVCGIWTLRHPVLRKCFFALWVQGLIVEDGVGSYRLTEKGKKRLA
jgi:hypothetical protein